MEQTLLSERYEFTSLLGRGGMGQVWLARDQRLRRDVAIKVLLPELAADPRIRRRFEDEARASAQLAHPNVVAVYDTGVHDDIPYLVMELLSGRTLADVIRKGPVDLALARRWADEILAAVAAAHGAGVLHRDLKPSNVLLTPEGTAKVADFGIAKIADDVDSTRTSAVLGTPAYLAPERLAGEAATPASDIFAVGVVLYEVLTGRCPFTGDHPMAIASAIQRGEYVRLLERRPDTPAPLAAAVTRAMAADPDERFSSAAAMAAAIADQRGTPAAAAVPGDATVAIVDNPTMSMPPMARPEAERRGSRSRAVWSAIATVAAFVALVLFGYVGYTIARNEVSSDATTSTTTPTTSSSTGAPPPSPVTIDSELDDALKQLENAVKP